MKIESVATAQTAELVAFYNSHNPEKLIKKFADRATAEKRVTALISQIEAEEAEAEASKAARGAEKAVKIVEKAASAVEKAAHRVESAAHAVSEQAKGEAKGPAPKAVEAPTALVPAGTSTSTALVVEEKPAAVKVAKDKAPTVSANLPRSNAAGIAASWKIPEVRGERLTRNSVIVKTDKGAFDFTSTKAAFVELGLPIEKHIRFRGKLKEAGKLSFEHKGKAYEFQIIG